jgi:hypothetical protein
MSAISERKTEGLFEFCDFMVEKGYATAGAIDPWRTAVRKILATVYGEEEFEGVDLTSLDIDDAVTRFETKTRGQYKHESVVAYGRRFRNAVDAYLEFVETGKAPQIGRPKAAAPKGDEKPTAAKAPKKKKAPAEQPMGELIKFPFPLQSGELAQLHLPPRIQKDDSERLQALIRTLQVEPRKEIPQRTGEEAEAA